MKWIMAFVLLTVSAFLTVRQIHSEIVCKFYYERDYLQLWELGVKSSTIQAKSQYVDEFFNALVEGKSTGKFADNDAIFLKHPNNSFASNLSALGTLSHRLKEIQGMNPNTFEYNTAIQQITAQEQNEAHEMLVVFQSCYELANYSNTWRWFHGLWVLGIVALWIFTVCMFGAAVQR